MSKVRIHPILREIAHIFSNHGKAVYLVGGAVRDLIRGEKSQDWDLATSATPQEVMELFRRVIPTGIKHGTVTILYKGHSLETTTFRTESEYSDGRRPDSIQFAPTIEEDLSRRDFTMNALAAELPSGHLVDPFGGQGDIQSRIIRCVGKPEQRFAEDGLRPLRAVRFAAQLGFTVEADTLAAISGALATTAKVSAERIRDELNKILACAQPSIALRLMEQTGLLSLILPELARCRGVEQKGFHRFDVLDHLLLSCDAVPPDRPVVRLAALFHDLGKPATRRMDPPGVWTFYQHEEESERLGREIMLRLRYPTVTVEKVAHLIRVHMFHYEESWTDAAVRRFIVRVGEENLADLYTLRRADAFGTQGVAPPADLNGPLASRVEGLLVQQRTLSIKDLAINGEDLAALGIPRGPIMGKILKELFETVLDDPALNTKEDLLKIAKKILEVPFGR
jgi:putative nucleotidyltransferase with HDIG domain